MNRSSYLHFIAIIVGFICCAAANNCFAQDKKEMKLTIPFDSLPVNNISATGNSKTGVLAIRMNFHNNYAKTANVSLDIGVFGDFGITDEKRKKYKIYTNSHLIGTKNINKGYQKISFVQFGDKKFDWVTIIQQDLLPDQEKTLIVRINNFNKDNKVLKEFHISCILALNYAHVGEMLYKIESLPITWK